MNLVHVGYILQVNLIVTAVALEVPSPGDSVLGWFAKAALGAAMAALAYFIKDIPKDLRENKKVLAKHQSILTQHGIMYQSWIDELAADLDGEYDDDPNKPKRRRGDTIKHLLGQLAKQEEERNAALDD